MRVRGVLAAFFGILGFLVGAALIAGSIWLLNEDRDDDDFYATETHRFERSSYAIVSGDFDQLTEVPSWLADVLTDPVDVRIAGVDADGEGLFVGIAPTADVDRYLSGVPHDEVDGLDIDGRSIDTVEYAGRAGTRTPTPPGDESFWVVSTEGVGTLSIEWSLESGSWTAVVMNADASAGVSTDLVFGARISNIVAIAWGVFAFGMFSVLLGGYLVYRGFRGRGVSQPTTQIVDLREQAPSHTTTDVADLPETDLVGAAHHDNKAFKTKGNK